MEVQRKGDVVFKTDQGTKIIHNVLFFLSLCDNLLSVGQMLDKSYPLNFSNKICTIVDENGNVLIESIKKKNWTPSIWLSTLVYSIELLISSGINTEGNKSQLLNTKINKLGISKYTW